MNGQEQQTRIAIVDDHEMFRAGVIATLQPYFDIIGQAADVEGSVAMIAQTKPDVVLLDVHVPGGEGGETPEKTYVGILMSEAPADGDTIVIVNNSAANGIQALTATVSGKKLAGKIYQQLIRQVFQTIHCYVEVFHVKTIL